jgi:hypothetical protein
MYLKAIGLAVGATMMCGGTTAWAQNAAASSAQQWRRLSVPEVQALLLNHKIGALNHFGEPVLVMHGQNGAVIAQAHPATTNPSLPPNPYAVVSDTGRWLMQGDQICVTMDHWSGHTEQCTHYLTNGIEYRREEASQYVGAQIYVDAVPWKGGTWTWHQ